MKKKTPDKVSKCLPQNYRENFIQSLFINFRVKYGIDGESMNDAGIRVRDLLNDYDKAKMLVASHGGTIKAAITTFLNLLISFN